MPGGTNTTKMDPLPKLPADLRVQVLIGCKTSISQLIQASPIMLCQYITSKAYIKRTLLRPLALDFDDDMVQDAMMIILTHSSNIHGRNSKTVRRLLRSWAQNELPNPLKTWDIRLFNQLDQLHTGLLFFIEDYLTKATAIFQPREYLCLPDMFSAQNTLVFKGSKVTTRFDSTKLTNPERRRLLRAFLHYEFECRTGRIKALTEFEREAVRCVETYVRSLYAAMFAQCGNSWLPEIPSNPLSTTGLLYPDVFYVSPDVYACDLGLSGSHFGMVRELKGAGLDLATALLQLATAGMQEREHLKMWFREYFESGHQSPRFIHRLIEVLSKHRIEDETQRHDSGMYQSLGLTFSSACALRRKVYRQRAWAFFDNHRFYAALGAPWSVSPASEQIDEEVAKLLFVEGWLSNPKATRHLHRSQKWHNERLGGSSENPETGETHDSNLDETSEYSLPPIGKEILYQELIPFWE